MPFSFLISAIAAYGARSGALRVAIAQSVSSGCTTTVGAGPASRSSARDAVASRIALASGATSTKKASTTPRPRRVSRTGGRRYEVVELAWRFTGLTVVVWVHPTTVNPV